MIELLGPILNKIFNNHFDDYTHLAVVIYIITTILIFLSSVVIPFFISSVFGWIIILLFITTIISFILVSLSSDSINDYKRIKFIVSILMLPFFLIIIISDLVIHPFMSYKGDNIIKIRRIKLKRVLRKTRFNKLKFWKK